MGYRERRSGCSRCLDPFGKCVVGWVFNLFQGQAMRRDDFDPRIPLPSREDLSWPTGWSLAPTNCERSTDECANHVVAESVSANRPNH